MTMRWFALFSFTLWALGPVACDATDEAVLAALAGGCLLDSDCESGLVCVFRVCHLRCQTSEDCPLRGEGDHQPCIVVDKPIRVCQLEAETACQLHSDCPGQLLCAIDGVCRTACGGDRDCVSGQLCAGGNCAAMSDLDSSGRLTVAPDAPKLGAPCLHHSDCPPGDGGEVLRCRERFCAVGCVGDDRDCDRFETCSTAGTDPAVAGECQLIGTVGNLHCSPKDDYPNEKEIACACPDGTSGIQSCNPDGSSYGPCSIAAVPCPLP